MSDHSTLLIDCDSCEMRNVACDDCVVTVIIGQIGHRSELAFDDTESRALTALANGGLVPHLRLVEGKRRPA
jgi:hypothetical protein